MRKVTSVMLIVLMLTLVAASVASARGRGGHGRVEPLGAIWKSAGF